MRRRAASTARRGLDQHRAQPTAWPKDERLGDERPRCRRVAVGVDLADDWPKVLDSQGFSPSSRTVWLIEGLLQYLDASDVDNLFARVDALSAPGSVLLYDVVGKTLLEAPFLQPTLEFMRRLGAPWTFGSDTPGRPRRGPGLDHHSHRCGRAWKQMESMGASSGPRRRARRAPRLLR
jgi:methyltransferase (TIGR00027 family)